MRAMPRSYGSPAACLDCPLMLCMSTQTGKRTLSKRHSSLTPFFLFRCALLARQFGFDWELCAAEPAWRWSLSALWRVAGIYACWAETGKRWARLIGCRPMLSRAR